LPRCEEKKPVRAHTGASGVSNERREKTTLREDTGKLLLDAGKLIFGSLFLGDILRGELPQVILMISGFAAAMVLCIIGLLVGKRKKPGGYPPAALARKPRRKRSKI